MNRPRPFKVGIDHSIIDIHRNGCEPITGRSLEECMIEWNDWWVDLMERIDTCPWWNIIGQWHIIQDRAILDKRMGTGESI